MSALAEWIGSVVSPWASLYADSAAVETAVMFLHLGGMVAAAGIAFTMDRAVFRSARHGWPHRKDLARQLHHSHGAILVGLGFVMLSGIALTLSDPEIFLESWIYWAKMAAVALLLANGWFLKRAGEELLKDPDDEGAFHRLRVSALRSGGLWALSLLGGIAITMYA